MYADLQYVVERGWAMPAGIQSQVINPATGGELAKLPHSTQADLDRILDAAQAGLNAWKAMSALERSNILRAAAGLVRDRVDFLANVLTLEQGKILAEARAEVLAAAETLEWCADEGRRSYGRVVPGRVPGMNHYVVKEPIGVVAAFAPWNFPAISPVRKIAAALGAGCSIIIKPSEETPGTAVEFARCLFDAGLPEGALSLVFGVPVEISEHLLASPVVKKVSFTGSTAVGKHLLRLSAETVKRATMELGGHAPVIIFNDADIEAAARLCVAGKFRNAGQVCISPTRFFVQREKHDLFVERFAYFASQIKVGDGLDPATQMGPLTSQRRLDAVDAIVRDAVEKGATLARGGTKIGNRGYFYAPTVLTNIPEDARILIEEPFGPIAPIIGFDTLDEVMAKANSLPFGLAAYAFTTSLETSKHVSISIEAGMIGINNLTISLPELPFGGVKESGYGSEGGIEGTEQYMVTKLISIS